MPLEPDKKPHGTEMFDHRRPLALRRRRPVAPRPVAPRPGSRDLLRLLSPCTKIVDYGRLLHLIRRLEAYPLA